MSNETLILKTAVATNSTVKLTDCPMSSGEILEMVCRLYANGLTSGNRCFKAIGNAVTYNTDAVTEGDIYCVSYRDGGFYVGLRTTEDYEPKEGDWWCCHIISSNWICDTQFVNKELIFNSYGLAYSVRYNGIVGNFITQSALQSTRGNWSKLMTNETPRRYKVVSNRDGLFIDYTTQNPWTEDVLVAGNNTLGAKDDLDVNKLPRLAMLWKPISNSDILSYQNTGKMGALMLSDAIDKSVTVSSNVLASLSAIEVDGTAVSCKQVGNLYITNTAVSGLVTSIGDVYKVLKDDTENV